MGRTGPAAGPKKFSEKQKLYKGRSPRVAHGLRGLPLVLCLSFEQTEGRFLSLWGGIMSFRRYFRPSVMVVAIAVLFLARPGQTQTESEAGPDGQDKIRERHAALCLELAEIQLEKRLELNRRMPDLFTEEELRRYRMNVNVAKRHLVAVHRDGDALEIHLQHAREQADVAQAKYRDAMKAVEKMPNVYSKYEMAEFRLQAEIAKLRMEIFEHPENNVLSMMDHVHWQLERVSEEVLELQRRIDKLEAK